jgi:hypothetical protein
MEQDTMGEECGHKRGLIYRDHSGELTLLEDCGETLITKNITDYDNIYNSLTDAQASIVDIKRQPFGGVSLRDIAVIDFAKDFGETPRNAWEAIKHSLETDPRELVMTMYNDPDLNE